MEDADTYRWRDLAAANVGAPLVVIADGRDPWQVFFDERMLGHARVDPCSKILKRRLIDGWLREHHDPSDTTVYVGVDWTESHRFERLRDLRAREGWHYEAPLCEPPYLSKADVRRWAAAEGLPPQRLYQLGFPHANCGGFCIKAGQAHFRHLLKVMPERYAYHERREQEFREFLGKDVAILRDRRGGESRPLTLRALRERVEAGGQCDLWEWGGCGCFTDAEGEDTP
jgi:hypothetical protein